VKCFTKVEVARACQNEQVDKIAPDFLYMLDGLAGYSPAGRRLISPILFMPTKTLSGIPVAGWCEPSTGAHATGSMHYLGRAADVYAPEISLAGFWLTALRLPFTGVGIYPYWRPHPGLHLDQRPVLAGASRTLWWRDKTGSYQYLNTDEDIKMMLETLRGL